MALLNPRVSFAPYEYDRAYQFWELQSQSHWLHTEVSLASDIHDWKLNLTDSEKNVIGNILKSFTQSEVFIQEYWSQMVSKWFKKPEIQMMAAVFASFESIHAVAYAYLNQSLGLEDFSAFLQEPTAKAKIDRLITTKGKSKEEIAKSLAVFSAFNEGVNLFSSFAVLLNFARFDKMKGLGQIITFSIKDESLHCLPIETRVRVKNKGFIPLSEVNTGDIVYGYKHGQIVETPVRDKVRGTHTGQIVKFDCQAIKQTVTDGHYMYTKDDEYISVMDFIKTKSVDDIVRKALPLDSNIDYPISDGLLRLMVAVQADGCYSQKRPDEIRLHLYKERKIKRLEGIFCQLGYNLEWKVNKTSDGRIKYTTSAKSFPIELRHSIRRMMPDKTFPDWFRNLSTRQKQLVCDEVKYWDGGTIYKGDSYESYQYCSRVQKNSELVAEMLIDLGILPRVIRRTFTNNKRNDSFLVLWTSDKLETCHNDHGKGHGIKADRYQVEQVVDLEVGCLTTGTNNFLIMTDAGTVELTGNSAAGCWLFRTLISEYPDIFTDELKKELYEAARLTIDLEDAFIDKAFELGPIEGMDPKDLKNFIRHRANEKLIEINLKPNWRNIDKESLRRMEWFDVMSAGTTSQDFFAGRVSDYAKGTIDFSTIWD